MPESSLAPGDFRPPAPKSRQQIIAAMWAERICNLKGCRARFWVPENVDVRVCPVHADPRMELVGWVCGLEGCPDFWLEGGVEPWISPNGLHHVGDMGA